MKKNKPISSNQEENTLANGIITKDMDLVSKNDLMDHNTKVHDKKIILMDEGSLFEQIKATMKENGGKV